MAEILLEAVEEVFDEVRQGICELSLRGWPCRSLALGLNPSTRADRGGRQALQVFG